MSKRVTRPERGPRRELGVETDAAVVEAGISLPPITTRRSSPGDEESRGHERGALVSYFRDIAEIPTLGKEEEVLLAKEIEAATLAFREGMIRIPWTSVEAVRIWRTLKAENSATGKMCEQFGSGSPEGEDLGARVDAILSKLEALANKRQVARDAGKRQLMETYERRMARLLREADLSMQLLGRMRRGLLQHRD